EMSKLKQRLRPVTATNLESVAVEHDATEVEAHVTTATNSPAPKLSTRIGAVPRQGANDPYAPLKLRVHHACITKLGPELFAKDRSQDEQVRRVIAAVREQLEADETPLSREDRERLVQEIADDVLGFGPLEPLLKDETVTEIMVNGPGQVYVERHGRVEAIASVSADAAHLLRS